MKALLETLCDKYLLNLGIITDLYPLDREILYPVCANIFCAADAQFELEKFTAGVSLIKENPKMLSSFRSTLRPLIASCLSVSDDPRGEMEKYLGCYELMRKYFRNSEHIALMSLLTARIVPPEKIEVYIKRGRQLYDRMKREHRILTTKEDIAFSVMLAFSEKSDDALMSDIGQGYKLLRRSADNNSILTVAHVLAMGESETEEKCAKFSDLCGKMLGKRREYGKYYELAMLASLAIADYDSSEILGDIHDIEEFISRHKTVFDLSEFGTGEPVSHAFMLLTTAYASDESICDEVKKRVLMAARQTSLYSLMVYSMMTVPPVVPEL